MTSHPQTASVAGVARRPTPPRSAASVRAFGSPVTYTPEQYDPRHAPAPISVGIGGYGLVHPKHRTGRGVWLALLIIAASVAGFLGWRVTHSGTAPESGIAYTSAVAHFSARFPAQPVELTHSQRIGANKLVVHFSYVVGQGGIAEAEVRGPLHGDLSKLGRQFAAGLGSSGKVDLTGVKNFRFQGLPARQGNFIQANSGELMTELLVAASERRVYIVLALTGPSFDALKDSFTIVQ